MKTNNPVSIEDVRHLYECTDKQALEALEQALNNEATVSQIWLALHFHAKEMGLKEKEG
jgi:hypothetical protein